MELTPGHPVRAAGRAPGSEPLPSTLPGLGNQSRAKPPTCRGPGPRARVRGRTDSARAPRSARAGGRAAEGRWGRGGAQPSAGSRPRGLCRRERWGSAAVQPARRRRSPPPGSPEAPRLPEREVEPSPRRRPRRRESSGGAGAAGAGGAARGEPRGEWGSPPRPAGCGTRGGGGAASRRSPARDLGEAVQPGGWCGARPPAVLPAGLRAPASGGDAAPRGSGGSPGRGAAPSGDARGCAREAPREGPGCDPPSVTWLHQPS